MNDLIIKTALGQNTERTPVWVMRQAGRILKEYRAVRASVSGFVELVKTPELAAEVTIQPVDLLGTDAAIIFSDILVVPEAMGLPYKMVESKGPIFEQVVDSEQALKIVKEGQHEDFDYVYKALQITKKELNGRVPLIGFAGAPWTIFTYMVEGQGSKTFSKARRMLVERPDMATQLLDKITATTITYLKGQIANGAQIVQLFDSWAGVLSADMYQTYGIRYIRAICDAITEVPIIVFPKGGYFSLKAFGGVKCEVVGLDWCTDICYAQHMLDNKVLQGNLDPAVLYGSFSDIKRQTINMLNKFEKGRHIANLGHGVYPDTDPDKVRCFIDTVKEHGGL